jgi:saccharopine dehydrogenase-like NADP-dependent oxidoreductase
VTLAKAISLDVTDDDALDAAVAQHELVISLIPYTFHATVIKSAIRHKKHVVTTSYISPSMLQLDQQAKDAGITVMNEIGVSHTKFFFFRISDHYQLDRNRPFVRPCCH